MPVQYTVRGTIGPSLVPRPFCGGGKNGLVYTVDLCALFPQKQGNSCTFENPPLNSNVILRCMYIPSLVPRPSAPSALLTFELARVRVQRSKEHWRLIWTCYTIKNGRSRRICVRFQPRKSDGKQSHRFRILWNSLQGQARRANLRRQNSPPDSSGPQQPQKPGEL